MINLKVIKKLNPCKDRLNNYIKFYNNKDFTYRQFMGLKNITHDDKLWVAFRLLSTKKIPLAAADIAELVLPIFEQQYPTDDRPRKAIEAARSGNKDAATYAASAAYNATYVANAAYAAYAAFAAISASHAAHAANASNAANAAYNAARAAYAANASNAAVNANNSEIKKKIRTILLKYLKEVK